MDFDELDGYLPSQRVELSRVTTTDIGVVLGGIGGWRDVELARQKLTLDCRQDLVVGMRMGDAEAEGLAVRCTEAASRLVTVAVMMRVSDDARNRDRRQRGQDREKSKQSGLLHDGRVLPMMRDGEMREKERERER
jgi:hypothetical protein